ncbi:MULTISPECIES: aldose epimerase family protein [Lactobacillus]|uniref:Maltose epimerase n=1 Tax=Lactobacillus xujianguonis TaxID=2495899 RepID=A0A437SUY9_9LACO|nr:MULTISPECIES: aldose epimerase family protein [Lactobacillus]RVU70753.1 galactose mutarotase [Lactobacillus xujianguonis]RVU73984.1 galactose mutarotase [Lactobacillus xujianguonis]
MKTMIRKYGMMGTKDLCEITLINDNDVHATILNYGATLERFEIPTPTGRENIIMSLETPENYSKERNYLGGTVGRVAGRIRRGLWHHDHTFTKLPINEGENSLHGGGDHGLDNRPWDFRTACDDHSAKAIFTLYDPDGSNNYPGNMKIMVTYELDNDNNLHYNITAYTDKTTLFNPTNHTYFRLDGPHANVEDLKMQINADYYVPVDDTTMPVEGIRKVDNSVFDFRKAKRLGDVINDKKEHQIAVRGGLDHPFILNGNGPAAVIESAKSKRKLTMTTDAPSVVVFTANGFNHQGAMRNLGNHDGVTLEAQVAPEMGADLDAFVLVPGEKFERNVNWHIDY